MDDLFNELYRTQIVSNVDLRSGYHQIRMMHEDVLEIAFITHLGLYEFLVMTFNLTKAAAIFQALMNSVFTS